MAERSTQNFARINDNLSEQTFSSAFSVQSARSNKLSNTVNPDEVIKTLSQSYENRRAAQVFKWEAARLSGAPYRPGTT